MKDFGNLDWANLMRRAYKGSLPETVTVQSALDAIEFPKESRSKYYCGKMRCTIFDLGYRNKPSGHSYVMTYPNYPRLSSDELRKVRDDCLLLWLTTGK